MRPHFVSCFRAFFRGDFFPFFSRFPQSFRLKRQSQQRFESMFRRSSDCALASAHFPQLFNMRQIRHSGSPCNAVNPAFGKCHHCFKRCQSVFLLVCVPHCHLRQVYGRRNGRRIDILSLSELFFHRIQVNLDFARILAYKSLETRHKPGYGREKPCVRGFDKSQEIAHFCFVDVKLGCVSIGILNNQSSRRIVRKRDSLIETSSHFRSQISCRFSHMNRITRIAEQFENLGSVIQIFRHGN